MGEFFGEGLIKLLQFWQRWNCRSCGLSSQLTDLQDGSTIHCWVPQKQSASTATSCKPSVVLIHGFGSDGLSTWANQIPVLTRAGYRVYVPDLLFFGKSFSVNSCRTEVYQAECIYKMLLQLKVSGEVVVVGISYGGFVAFRMAHMYPNFVSKLVIIDSGICMDPSTNDELLEEFNASHIHQVMMSTNVQTLKKSMRRVYYKSLRFIPDFMFVAFIKVNNFNEKQRIELLDALTIGKKDSNPLPQLTCQDMLIVWGEQDGIFKLDLGYKLEKHLGGKVKLVVIPKCGHVPVIEKPKLFNSCLLSFLQESNHKNHHE